MMRISRNVTPVAQSVMARRLYASGSYPNDRKYTKDHEWVLVDGSEGLVGITDHAQSALGDVVYVDLPEPQSPVLRGEAFGAVESVKVASDLFAPVSGEVVAVNEDLGDDPAKVNAEPYGNGWMIRVKLSNPAELEDLLSADAYTKYLETL